MEGLKKTMDRWGNAIALIVIVIIALLSKVTMVIAIISLSGLYLAECSTLLARKLSEDKSKHEEVKGIESLWIPDQPEADLRAIVAFSAQFIVVFVGAAHLCRLSPRGVEFVRLLLVLVTAYITDAAAYFVGRNYGKVKVFGRLSPKKTREGCIGGWAAGSLIAFLVISVGSALLQASLFTTSNVLLAILGPAAGIAGDLFESISKRVWDADDSGEVIMATRWKFVEWIVRHMGGWADRLDSLMMVALFSAILSAIF